MKFDFEPINNPVEFQWDRGNKDKNWIKHKVTNAESEQTFLNNPIYSECNKEHYQTTEQRYVAFGETNARRRLFEIFTIRNKSIRIICARDMSGKERRFYEDHR